MGWAGLGCLGPGERKSVCSGRGGAASLAWLQQQGGLGKLCVKGQLIHIPGGHV